MAMTPNIMYVPIKYLPTLVDTATTKYADSNNYFSGQEVICLVDFYDWLTYVASVGSEGGIVSERLTFYKPTNYYVEVYNTYLEFIHESSVLRDNNLMQFLAYYKKPIKELLVCYICFTKELEYLQKKYLEAYSKVNVHKMPRLYIPFSWALNRLASKHLNFDNLTTVNDEVEYTKGILQDSCHRIPTDKILSLIPIYTYSVEVTETDLPRLPADWKLYDLDPKTGERKLMQSRHAQVTIASYIADTYSQYKYVGFSQIEGSQVFLLNYPFLQSKMKLSLVEAKNVVRTSVLQNDKQKAQLNLNLNY